jgi:hypothetical protein
MPHAEHSPIPELSILALTRSHACESGMLPEDARGIVVHAYCEGVGYEVEFDEPIRCVVTVQRHDIRQV